MACAEENGTPPFELRLAWQMERYHALPDNGGLLDQRYKLMRVAATLKQVYAAITGYNAAGIERAKWSNNYPELARTRNWALTLIGDV